MRSYKPFVLALSLLIVAVFVLANSVNTNAVPVGAVIDFEGIPPGTIVDQVYSGYGISGAPIEGYVIVNGHNPVFGEGVNAAMIFDMRCPPGAPEFCTGGDKDLYNPDFGNSLIISEDLDQSDPDDADVVGAVFEFEYSQLGDGKGADIVSLEVQDVEEEETEDARMYFYEGGLDGTLKGSVDIPETGDAQAKVVPINVTGVDAIRIDLQGSGTVNNIVLFTEPNYVELLYFKVERSDDGVVFITWATATEVDNAGFYIYRSPDNSLDNAVPIHFKAAGGGSTGHTYSYQDNPPGGNAWFYWLSDVDTSGKETFHLPEAARTLYNHINYLPIASFSH